MLSEDGYVFENTSSNFVKIGDEVFVIAQIKQNDCTLLRKQFLPQSVTLKN